MQKKCLSALSVFLLVLSPGKFLFAQQAPCKVLVDSLAGEYTGECKNGLANGHGETKGILHFIGAFKNGMPNGAGACYYPDSSFYQGNFQDGIKEGKGEMHYRLNNRPDSVIKGYWSGNDYRGNRYITYSFDAASKFDRVDISPSSGSGSRVSIEISNASETPNNLHGGAGLPTRAVTLNNLICPGDPVNIKLLSMHQTSAVAYAEFEITKFPVVLKGTLSSGEDFELQLYKCADWRVRFYTNWR